MENGSKLYSTPEEMYGFIASYAKGKLFCDLGCGRGKILDAMDGIALGLVGIENNKDISTDNKELVASAKKHKIILGDFTKQLPDAEVYYLWVGDPKKRLAPIMDKLKGKTVLVGAHKGTREVQFVKDNCRVIFTSATSVGNGEFSVGVIEP